MNSPEGASPMVFASVGFFYDPRFAQVLLHLRSADAPTHPAKWACFGGSSEAGETPLQCFCREIEEELGLRLDGDEVSHLRSFMNPNTGRYRHLFVVERFVAPEIIRLGEGSGFGWIPVEKVTGYDLTDSTRKDLEFFLSTRRPATT